MAYKINFSNPIPNKSMVKCRAAAQTVAQAAGVAYRVDFQTLEACKLGIARYPDFEYDARGGVGNAVGRQASEDKEISVSLDVETLYIPALTGATTRFLGLPLPPFPKIEIVLEAFEGTIYKESGKRSNMILNLLRCSKVLVLDRSAVQSSSVSGATLTSEESRGRIRSGKGERIEEEEGKCRLIGVATVDPIGDVLMDSFLGLPTECVAIMNAKVLLTADES